MAMNPAEHATRGIGTDNVIEPPVDRHRNREGAAPPLTERRRPSEPQQDAKNIDTRL
jgi:hypothetical protein